MYFVIMNRGPLEEGVEGERNRVKGKVWRRSNGSFFGEQSGSQAGTLFHVVLEAVLAGPDLAGSLNARDRSDARDLSAVDATRAGASTALLDVGLPRIARGQHRDKVTTTKQDRRRGGRTPVSTHS